MAFGLRIRHPVTGAVLLDTTTGMSRILGSVVTVPGQAGQVTNIVGFSTGTPFAVSYAQGVPNIGSSQTYPVHAISGTTLSWNASPLASRIIYGVYAGTIAGKSGSGAIGARFLNDNLATQIDTLYANHVLLQQGSVSIPANGTQTITLACTAPLLAYRGSSWVTVLEQLNNGNGTWTLVLGAPQGGASGTYYIFDAPSAASALYDTLYGMRIRNPSTGAVVFDSRMKYLRIVQIRANAADQHLPAQPVTTALGRDNLAVIIDPGLWFNQSQRQSQDPNGSPIYTDVYSPYFVGAGVNGMTLTEGSVSVGSESPVVPGNVQQGTTILVDVSSF